jgi:hypothetical protein
MERILVEHERRKADEKMHTLDLELNELEGDLKTHVVQCEERWRTNFDRLNIIDLSLKRIEARIITGAAGLIAFLSALIVTILMNK